MAPNDSLHAVELPHRSGKPCANCVDPSRAQQWGPDYRFGASRPCGPTGWLAMLLIKAGDVETNPGPTTTRICDICHRQIQVRLHEEPVPAEILDVMNRRDDLRKRDTTSPELPKLNKDSQNRICVHK